MTVHSHQRAALSGKEAFCWYLVSYDVGGQPRVGWVAQGANFGDQQDRWDDSGMTREGFDYYIAPSPPILVPTSQQPAEDPAQQSAQRP